MTPEPAPSCQRRMWIPDMSLWDCRLRINTTSNWVLALLKHGNLAYFWFYSSSLLQDKAFHPHSYYKCIHSWYWKCPQHSRLRHIHQTPYVGTLRRCMKNAGSTTVANVVVNFQSSNASWYLQPSRLVIFCDRRIFQMIFNNATITNTRRNRTLRVKLQAVRRNSSSLLWRLS